MGNDADFLFEYTKWQTSNGMKCIVYKYSVDGQSVGSIQSKIGIVLHDTCKNKSPSIQRKYFIAKKFSTERITNEKEIYMNIVAKRDAQYM